MTHGGKSTVEPFEDYEESEPTQLRWRMTGPWQWALGDFGTVRGFDGLPWIVEIVGRPQKMFRTLAAARRALENAALAEAHEVIPGGDG